MRPNSDDTVLIQRGAPPPAPRRPLAGLLAGAAVLAVLAFGGTWWAMRSGPAEAPAAPPLAAPLAIPPTLPPAAPPAASLEPIPLATEAAVAAQSPAVRTAMRFAANPAVVILDFPTLHEQGRMLNRLGREGRGAA